MPNYWEMDGYPREERSVDGSFVATRRILCAWTDRSDVRNELLANNGQNYPYLPGFQARLVSIATEPLGRQEPTTPDTQATYPLAVMTLTYRTPTLGQPVTNDNAPTDPTQLFSEDLEPYTEAMRLPATDFEWVNTVGSPGVRTVSDDEAPFVQVSRANYVLTRYNLTTIPQQAIDFVGKINSVAIRPRLIATWTFAAQTLLFEPPTLRMGADDATGRPKFSATYRFKYRAETWRKFWRSDVQGYDTMRLKKTGTSWAYPEAADFSVLMPT